MGRPADWSPLAASDPVPGDPGEVAALGTRFGTTASEIQQCCARLRSMCDGPVWESDAGDAFRSHCDESASKLSQAFARYDAAGRALGTSSGDAAAPTATRPNYAGALGHAQALSLQAWTTAQDAEQNQRQALSWLQTLYDAKPFAAAALSFPGATPGTTALLGSSPHDTSDEAAAKRRYNAASEDLVAAQRLVSEAVQLRDTAAGYAAALITQVIDHDGLGDTFWDHVVNLIDEHAAGIAAVSKISGWIATVCGTLALLVGWIPYVGKGLASILNGIALAASIVQLICDVLLEIGGKGSWYDIAMDAIAVVVYAFGGGAVSGVKDSALLARGAARVARFQDFLRDLMSGDTWLMGGEKALEEELPKGWAAVSKDLGATKDEFTEALERGSAPWPGWGRILRAVNPVSVLKDSFADIGDLKWSNWRSLVDPATWKGVSPFVGDPEIHAAVQNLGEDLKDVAEVPAVHAFLANVDSNRALWRFVTVPAVTADWADHFLTVTRFRDRFLDDIGLGWAK
jgi:hypothetical protein